MKLGFDRIILFAIIICIIIVIIVSCICKKNVNKHTETINKVDEAQTIIAEMNDTSESNPSNFVDITDETNATDTMTEVIVTEAEQEVTIEENDDDFNLVSLGNFKLTAYCSCAKCCGKFALNRPIDEYGNEIVYGSIGTRLTAGISIAVDPNVIPYGSDVIIDGHTYTAHDTGGAIKGNRIDVYFDDHQAALNFGVQYADVYMKQ